MMFSALTNFGQITHRCCRNILHCSGEQLSAWSLAMKYSGSKGEGGKMILIQAVAILPYNRAYEEIPKNIT